MTNFVLIPGAGGNASYWTWLKPELETRGHEVVAVDIPQDDPALGLSDWADAVVRAIGDRENVVLVAQSLGGFIAPLVAERVASTRLVVLLNAMIPLPNERPDDWWEASGSGAARQQADEAAGRDSEFTVEGHFFHDIPADRLNEMMSMPPPREPSATAMADQCRFTAWPNEVSVLVADDDRFFPADFQRRIARERLDRDTEAIPGGHLAAVSYPAELAQKLADLAP